MMLWSAIASGLVKRGAAVLITIRDARGSSPRDAGTRMVFFADGTFTGTIGGGTLEWHAIAEAQRLLLKKQDVPQSDDADLVTAFTSRSYALGPQLGQCCGGRVTLGFEVIRPTNRAAVQIFALQEAEGPFCATAIEDNGVMKRRIVSSANAAADAIETFGEDKRKLILFGAGHVGRALVLAMSALPFDIIWIDSRPDAFPSVVPANVTMICQADPLTAFAQASDGSFVLIMTHSHELDLALCDIALRSGKFPYVGLIGSATKRARFERRLIEAGISEDTVRELVCPIGNIGPKSKLPAAIAMATAVELLVKDELCLKVGVAERSSTGAVARPNVICGEKDQERSGGC